MYLLGWDRHAEPAELPIAFIVQSLLFQPQRLLGRRFGNNLAGALPCQVLPRPPCLGAGPHYCPSLAITALHLVLSPHSPQQAGLAWESEVERFH